MLKALLPIYNVLNTLTVGVWAPVNKKEAFSTFQQSSQNQSRNLEKMLLDSIYSQVIQ